MDLKAYYQANFEGKELFCAVRYISSESVCE